MTKFWESRPGKKTEETSTENKTEPVWYKTRQGVLIAIFFLLLIFLIWGVFGKPKWLKIEVSNCFVALLAAGIAYLFLHVRPRVIN